MIPDPTTPAPRRMSDEEMEIAKDWAAVRPNSEYEERAIYYIQLLRSHIAALDAERAAVAGEAKSILRRLDESGGTGLDLSPGDELSRDAATLIRSILIERDRRGAIIEKLRDASAWMVYDKPSDAPNKKVVCVSCRLCDEETKLGEPEHHDFDCPLKELEPRIYALRNSPGGGMGGGEAEMICSKCGKHGPHYVVPSLGESGFFICDPEVIQQPYDKDITMSTNCIRCVTNRRTGHDLLCDECSAKKSAAAAPAYIPAEQLEPGFYSAEYIPTEYRVPVNLIKGPLKQLVARRIGSTEIFELLNFKNFLPLDLTASVPELRERIYELEKLLRKVVKDPGFNIIEEIHAALAASREGGK